MLEMEQEILPISSIFLFRLNLFQWPLADSLKGNRFKSNGCQGERL